MTHDERLNIEMMIDDCERAAVKLAETTRIKIVFDAKLKDYLRKLESESGGQS